MAMATIAEVEKDLLDSLRELEREANKVYHELVLPNWQGVFHGFGQTAHAYMMSALAHVDLASAYWRGSDAGQTARMEAFLSGPLALPAEVAKVLVKMWRHVLMHTAKPRRLLRRDGRYYYWLVQWSSHLPRSDHMTFVDTPDMRVLNIGVLYFLGELRAASEQVVSDLKASTAAATAALQVFNKYNGQRL
jgi:hypothetical protein